MNTARLGVVILAAGEGTRMHSRLPKVLHPVCGKPLLDHVLTTAQAVGAQECALVAAPHTLDQLRERYGETIHYATQAERLGTAHAVGQARSLLEGRVDRVLVLYGPDPLLRTESVTQLVALLDLPNVVGAITTFVPPVAKGYGRIIRDTAGQFLRIVEERDTTPAEKQIVEVNQGVVAYQAAWLWEHLAQIHPSPHSKEYYLTDLVELAVAERGPGAVQTLLLDDPSEGLGVNDRVQLAEVEAEMRHRVLHNLMLQGVTITDPSHTYVDVDVQVGQDTVLLPGTMLHGTTVIGPNCVIGPNSIVRDSKVGAGCQVTASVLDGATMDDGANIGPFSRLRTGAHLMADVHVGNFAEIKKSILRPGVKMGHFSYVGDSDVGEETNIGAGTITANFAADGKKYRTTIGPRVFLGSDTTIIAPRTIGEDARTGAGSVVNHDVEAGVTVVGIPARPIKRKKSGQ